MQPWQPSDARARDQPAEQLFFLCSAEPRRPPSPLRRSARCGDVRWSPGVMHIGSASRQDPDACRRGCRRLAVAPARRAATLRALAPGDTPRRRPLFAKGVLSISLVRRDDEIERGGPGRGRAAASASRRVRAQRLLRWRRWGQLLRGEAWRGDCVVVGKETLERRRPARQAVREPPACAANCSAPHSAPTAAPPGA